MCCGVGHHGQGREVSDTITNILITLAGLNRTLIREDRNISVIRTQHSKQNQSGLVFKL